jgi:hypothetical protein
MHVVERLSAEQLCFALHLNGARLEDISGYSAYDRASARKEIPLLISKKLFTKEPLHPLHQGLLGLCNASCRPNRADTKDQAECFNPAAPVWPYSKYMAFHGAASFTPLHPKRAAESTRFRAVVRRRPDAALRLFGQVNLYKIPGMLKFCPYNSRDYGSRRPAV